MTFQLKRIEKAIRDIAAKEKKDTPETLNWRFIDITLTNANPNAYVPQYKLWQIISGCFYHTLNETTGIQCYNEKSVRFFRAWVTPETLASDVYPMDLSGSTVYLEYGDHINGELDANSTAWIRVKETLNYK